MHGRSVTVTVTRCTASGCRGDYRLGAVAHRDQAVIGAETARVGAAVAATVDGRHPGEATTADAALVAAEAGAFAAAGLAIAVVGLRACVRARRRGPAPESPVPAAVDDPLAWVRRRRFGAGG